VVSSLGKGKQTFKVCQALLVNPRGEIIKAGRRKFMGGGGGGGQGGRGGEFPRNNSEVMEGVQWLVHPQEKGRRSLGKGVPAEKNFWKEREDVLFQRSTHEHRK